MLPIAGILPLLALLLYELELLNESKLALRVMYYHHCAPARAPRLLKGPWGLVERPQTMKSL